MATSPLTCGVVTVNVRSILDHNRRRMMFANILDTMLLPVGRSACQLICLQETWLRNDCIQDAAADWRALAGDGAWAVFAPVDDDNRCAGTAVLYAPRPGANGMKPVTMNKAEWGLGGRVCAVNVQWHNTAMWLVSAYAPANTLAARAAFFRNMDAFMTDACIEDAVVGGDFNACLDDHHPDGSINRLSADVRALRAWARSHGATDAFLEYNAPASNFTYVNSNNIANTARRLDTLFMLGRVSDMSCACLVTDFRPADHRAVMVTLRQQNAASDATDSWWRLPPHALKNPLVRKRINAVSVEARARLDGGEDGAAVLGWLQGELTSSLKAAAVIIRRQRDAATRKVWADAGKADKLRRAGGMSIGGHCAVIGQANADDVRLRAQRSAAAANEARSHGDRPSSAFFSRLRPPQKRTTIKAAITPGGVRVTSYNGVSETTTRFWQRLFQGHKYVPAPGVPGDAADPADAPFDEQALERLLAHVPRKLSAAASAHIERPFTLAELEAAARAAPSGRSPGLDGLPAELFKVHIDVLGPVLLAGFNDAYARGRLPDSITQAAIVLLLKKGNDPDACGSYRPLAMLSAIYKILARMIANRLKTVIGAVCGEDQTAYIANRVIQENIELATAAIEIMRRDNSEGVAIAHDSQKAFDLCQHDALFRVMARMGFGPRFISWIRLLYNGATARVLVNGALGRAFGIFRGVRQGDPVSGFLYLILGELLRAAVVEVRSRRPLVGLTVGGVESLMSRFADDALFLLSHYRYVPTVLEAVAMYNASSGGRSNLDKTVALMPGSVSAEARAVIAAARIVFLEDGKPMRYLGAYIGRGITVEQQWRRALDSIASKAAFLRRFRLSLYARVVAAKAYLCSMLWFLAMVTDAGETIVHEAEQLVWNFIWKCDRIDDYSARGRITREEMCLPLAQGGMGMIPIAAQISACRLSVIAIVASNRNPTLSCFATDRHLGPVAASACGVAAWLSAPACAKATSSAAVLWRTHVLPALLLGPVSSREQTLAMPLFLNERLLNPSTNEPFSPTVAAGQLLVRKGITHVRHLTTQSGALHSVASWTHQFSADEQRRVRSLADANGQARRACDLGLLTGSIPMSQYRLLKSPQAFPASNAYYLRKEHANSIAAPHRALRVDSLLRGTNVRCTAFAVDRDQNLIEGSKVVVPSVLVSTSYAEAVVRVRNEYDIRCVGLMHDGADPCRGALVRVKRRRLAISALRIRTLAKLLRLPGPLLAACAGKWADKVPVPIPRAKWVGSNSVFGWLAKTDLCSNTQRELFWLIYHRRLAVGSWLRHLNLGVDGRCMWCNADVEDTEHLLWECAASRALWAHVLTLFNAMRFDAGRAAAAPSWSMEEYVALLFEKLPSLPAPSKSESALVKIWAVFRFEAVQVIWMRRNSLCSFEDRPAAPKYGVSALITDFNARIRRRIFEEHISPSRGLPPAAWRVRRALVVLDSRILRFSRCLGSADVHLGPPAPDVPGAQQPP